MLVYVVVEYFCFEFIIKVVLSLFVLFYDRFFLRVCFNFYCVVFKVFFGVVRGLIGFWVLKKM